MNAYHEITFGKAQLVRKAFPYSVLISALNLVVIVVQSNYVDASESGNLSCGTANTTTHVKDLHALSKAHHMRQIVFVSSNGLVEAFTVSETAEME